MKVTLELKEYSVSELKKLINTINYNKKHLDLSKNIKAKQENENMIIITQQGKVLPCVRIES